MMRCGGSRDRDGGRVAIMDKEAGVRRSGDMCMLFMSLMQI